MSEPAFTPQLAAIFAALVEEASGIHYGPPERDLFGSKVAAQAAEAGFESLLDYYYRLRYDDPEGVETRVLVEALTVHETYFFREIAPLRQLVEGHLTEIVRAQGAARVWSAACSTGEEPLTLAMLLEQHGLYDRVEIVATDISEAAILRARTGRHGRRSLREPYPTDLARKYLDVSPHGITSQARLREAIRFRTLNLFDEAAVEQLGRFDVILCRNVLIYFRDQSVTKAVARLTKSLAPSGILAVGVAESLLRFGTALACEERGGSFFYRSAR
ncbi:MAG: protein-glutamate O-methyltransferase CheR [Deltaproteobacteria bacterium]|nr:protein-glutamate O-methyltransferase CheR [Deltaproteobacteria bacterium]